MWQQTVVETPPPFCLRVCRDSRQLKWQVCRAGQALLAQLPKSSQSPLQPLVSQVNYAQQVRSDFIYIFAILYYRY